ncbi:AMSH-like ubiquitin thioesterase 2 [Ancistrocladus abbreviatus]
MILDQRSSHVQRIFQIPEIILPSHDVCVKQYSRAQNQDSRIIIEIEEVDNMVTYFPSLAISCTEIAPHAAQVSHVSGANSKAGHSESASNALRDVHISAQLMENFLQLARDNTDKDLETCGVLGAFLKEEIFYATTLIVPKQESTCNSCQALSEEEIFAIQNERSLFPVGWIHTHPSQRCFMSSIDLHTQYSYQVMVPEAIAIVVGPTDNTRSYGIFRLSDSGGMSILKECEEKGFHPHKELSSGDALYEDCSHVYINPNLRFEIFDLR